MRHDAGLYLLGDDGEPVQTHDAIAWGRWFQQADRHVAYTEVGDGYVSTVFLGLDHNWWGGPPVLWETMTFQIPGLQWEQRRYASRIDALAGHAEAVAMAQLAVQVAEAHR